jgi:hypothetical protein
MTIFENPAAALNGRYPNAGARLKHSLIGDPLFSLEALVGLAGRLPPDSVEYNAGDLSVDVDPAKTPANGLSIEETIRRIRDCKSWMVLKNVEQDPRYAAVLDRCLAEVDVATSGATGPMEKKVGFIFVSSPESVTPFHLDPEHNILMHLQGVKYFNLYEDKCGMVSDENHELYHVGAAHRNLRHQPSFDAYRTEHKMLPGDAVYVPLKAPHWVKNGPEPSVSFSITWRSRQSLDEASLRLANYRLRRMGLKPPSPGSRPLRDRAAVLAERAASRLVGPPRA